MAGLPAHTSHVLQPLDVGVFGPLKEAFRNVLSHRSVTSVKSNTRNDIFTVCDLLTKAYFSAVNAQNIIGGFAGSGMWVQRLRSPDPNLIKPTAFTSSFVSSATLDGIKVTRAKASLIESSDSPNTKVTNYKQLYELFLKNPRVFARMELWFSKMEQ